MDKVTTTKIPIVTGGFGNGWVVALDSTELLINEQWQSGTILVNWGVASGFPDMALLVKRP